MTVGQLQAILFSLVSEGYSAKPVKMALAGMDIGEVYTGRVRTVTAAGTCCLLE